MGRVVFPGVLTVHIDAVADAERSSFDRSLKLITGHVYVAAWYVAMYNALTQHDWSFVGSLWQAGLTVTLHCRVGLEDHQLAVPDEAAAIAAASARLARGSASWIRQLGSPTRWGRTPPDMQ